MRLGFSFHQDTHRRCAKLQGFHHSDEGTPCGVLNEENRIGKDAFCRERIRVASQNGGERKLSIGSVDLCSARRV